MAEGCNHNCSSCGESCSSRTAPQSLLETPHEGTKIKHIIAVISGKGGVGKSSVTTSLAVTLNRLGYKTAVLDADITGPSIPKMYGIHEKAQGTQEGILPMISCMRLKQRPESR